MAPLISPEYQITWRSLRRKGNGFLNIWARHGAKNIVINRAMASTHIMINEKTTGILESGISSVVIPK